MEAITLNTQHLAAYVKEAVSKLRDLWNTHETHSFTWLLTLGATTGVLAWMWRSWQWNRKYNLPPGPTPLPFLGNLREVNFMAQNFPAQVQELRKTYGDALTIWMGPYPVVVISSVELAREAYLQKGNDYAGRPTTWSTDYFSRGGKDIFAGQFHPVWQAQRKIAHASLRKYATGQTFEDLLHTSFEDICSSIIDTNEPIDVMEIMTTLIYNVFGKMMFGKADFKLIRNVQQDLTDFVDATRNGYLADAIPGFHYLNTKSVRAFKTMTDKVTKCMKDAYDDHLQTYDPANITDLTYELINQQKTAETEDGSASKDLTEEHFFMVMLDIFLAGTDTTRITLTFLVGYMCAYPEVQKKMQQEIDDYLGTEGQMAFSARKHLPYTEAVLHEVMRHMPVVPVGAMHTTTCDTTLGEYRLPKGTMVTMNVQGIHFDEQNFTDAAEFKPERWLDKDGQFVYNPYHFMAFSMGRRVCVGETLARVELHALTAMFFQKFTVRPAEGQVVPPPAEFLFDSYMPSSLLVHAEARSGKI